MAEVAQDEPSVPITAFSGRITINRNKLLGKGNFAMVFAGKWKEMEGVLKESEESDVAVKRVEHLHVDDRETIVQIQLQHDNVVRILAVEDDDDFRYIVLELCVGSLQQVIEKKYKGPPLLLPSDAQVLYQIANGLEYIHLKGMIHRDVKPGNILISTKGVIKISDFGVSKKIDAGVYAMSGKRGTYSWMAPEVLRWCLPNSGNQNVENQFTTKSDIFCAGCVFFVYVTEENKHPFGDNDIDRPYNISANIIRNKGCLLENHFAAAIITKMIKHNPEERISLQVVKETLMEQLRLQVHRITETHDIIVE